MRVSEVFVAAACLLTTALSAPALTTYTNPIIPGWHSDPSCIYEKSEGTFFCTTSTFILFPGIPIYASKDLINWKLVSHVFSRPSQVPQLTTATDQQGGMYAATLRYRNGKFYIIVAFLNANPGHNYIFTSNDPYSDASWSDPVIVTLDYGYDPDIFWDDDGTAYVTVANNPVLSTFSVNITTGANGPVNSHVYNGTGGVYPEGPHYYKKDGYYYVMIAEGGTATDHAETMARSKERVGPWEADPKNPLITARNTNNYFQTVGHADLFQDANGNWWAVALGTRSGAAWTNFPMGRETVLVPATWEKGQFPVLQSAQGKMKGPLPPTNKNVKGGSGPFVDAPDNYKFQPGSKIPPHFAYWRFPDPAAYTVSPAGHPNTLALKPSSSNITGPIAVPAPDVLITLIMRRQTDTLFTYSADFTYAPKKANEESGVSLFITQLQHVDLGIVLLPSSTGKDLSLSLRFRVTAKGNYNGPPIPEKVVPVPKAWKDAALRLQIKAFNSTHYSFSAASVDEPEKSVVVGVAPGTLVSDGTGPFTGSLVGAYATSNGGNGTTNSYVSNWKYQGQGQQIDYDVIVPSK